MKRLTTDNPQDNFSTTLNYVFSKDGLAYIRSDGESDEPVLLTDWANRRCIQHRCIGKSHSVDTFKEIDERICDCAFANPQCPVFLAYTFACQAVHMRDRCKTYEDAEEQGLLVKLPCKVGDTVWMVNDNEKISEMVIRHIQTNGTGELYFYAKCKTMTVECFCITGCKCEICFSEKSMKEHRIFTTRKAAEAALKEMEKH